VLDGDLEESKTSAFFAFTHRVCTEHARMKHQEDGSWISARDLLWLRWTTVFVPRAGLASLVADLASSAVDTERLLMRAACPLSLEPHRATGLDELRRPRAPGVPQQVYNCWQEVKVGLERLFFLIASSLTLQ
jgi:hypothetical protein